MSIVQLVGAPTTLTWVSSTAGESATLAVTKPDGTALAAPSVTDEGTSHKVTVTPDLPGRYVLLWSTPTEKYADVVDVWPTDPHYLVSRGDALERLSESQTTGSARFAALSLYIASATAVVEYITGPLIKSEKTWTEVLMYPTRAMVLPHTDIAVTSVTVDGNELGEDDYMVDEDAGIVHSRTHMFYDKVSIGFTAGDQQIPPQARQACLEIIAHMWMATRQDGRPEPAGEDTVMTPMGFAIPRRAQELLQSLPRAAGTA
jgi:hypothetical protein